MNRREVASDRYNIRVLDRAVRVLRLLSDGGARSLSEVHEALGISSSTTFRLLSSLAAHDLVSRDGQTGRYRLGLGCLELARAYSDGNDLRRAAMPELEKLRDATGETVHLAVLEGMEVVYLEKLPGLHAIGLMSSQVGGRAPAYCTGLGKVLLAYQPREKIRALYNGKPMKKYTKTTIDRISMLLDHLDQVAKQGYALDQREHEVEVECVAAPILGVGGQVMASISVSGPADRIKRQLMEKDLVRRTMEAAQAVSARLGYRGLRAKVTHELAEDLTSIPTR